MSLSVIVSVPEVMPAVWGAKKTPTKHDSPGFSGVEREQVERTVSTVNPLLAEKLVKVSAVVPELETSTDCVGVVEPTGTLLKTNVSAVGVTLRMRLLDVSAMKTAPLPSTATPVG